MFSWVGAGRGGGGSQKDSAAAGFKSTATDDLAETFVIIALCAVLLLCVGVPSNAARVPSAGRAQAAAAGVGAAAGQRPAGKPSPSPSQNARGGWPY
jgi:hypothetical protein